MKYVNDTSHPLYAKWRHIKERCFNQNHKKFNIYGGRGIGMYSEWVESYDSFYIWAILNGWKQDLQIDRFPNKDGNYEPNNCRFVTNRENCRNKRNNILFTHNGETRCLKDWCEILELKYRTIHKRINFSGWTFEEAICVQV